jgi:predicted nuclease of predicted toxin-antitoxin system
MRFLSDENIPKSVLNWLRANGHDVVSATESGIGKVDSAWIEFALLETRLILTSDKDYGDLIFRDGMKSYGIVLLRFDSIPVTSWVTRLQECWSIIEANPSGRFITISETRVRVRPLT